MPMRSMRSFTRPPRFDGVPLRHQRVLDRPKLLLRHPEPFANERAEGVPVVGDLVPECILRCLPILRYRTPDAGCQVDLVDRSPSELGTLCDQRLHCGVVLGREEERQHAVGDFTGQSQHPGAHGRQVDRDPPRRKAQIGFRLPIGRFLPGQHRGNLQDSASRVVQWTLLWDADPLQKLARTGADAEVEASATQLVQRGRHHSDLGWMLCVGIDDARADFDALGCLRHCRQNDRSAAHEQVVAHPELLETGLFGDLRHLNVVGDRQIIVQAQAEAQGHLLPNATYHPMA